MRDKKILVTGGSGFVGSHLVTALVQQGAKVRVPTRRAVRARHLRLLPTVDVIEGDIHDVHQLATFMAGQDVVINLVGILHGQGGDVAASFNQIHVEFPRKLAAAAIRAQVKHILHVSALGAAPQSSSHYQTSKAMGEDLLRRSRSKIPLTILRPSVIFGPGDTFLNLFANLLPWAPLLPLAGAGNRLQPVYVKDVVQVMLMALQQEEAGQNAYELGGPSIYTLREIVTYIGQLIGHRPWIIPIPHSLAMLQAMLMEYLPGRPLLSRDNVKSLMVDNVCKTQPCLPFGIVATPLEEVAPAMLQHENFRSEFQSLRTRAGR